MNTIDWTCDTCHGSTNGSGAIHIPYSEIRLAEKNRKEWLDCPQDGSQPNWTVADAVSPPNLGLWKVECNSCANTCDGSYWIDLTRAQTVAALDWWTEHLCAKTWYMATNWTAIVASVGETHLVRGTA